MKNIILFKLFLKIRYVNTHVKYKELPKLLSYTGVT
jgi:hypothetical protein